MPSLYWAIHWEYGLRTINPELETLLTQGIRQEIRGRLFQASDIGLKLERLVIQIKSTRVIYSAQLEKIDPPTSFIADTSTNIYVALADHQGLPESRNPGQPTSSPTTEFDEFVMWQVVFDPAKPETHYMNIYDSLMGIEKTEILEETASLLLPYEAREYWSRRHYGTIAPILKVTTSKAPVIIFSGDPGTGKTALATSIGAPLALRLRERVHFRHMSLMMRGMGYQGRAGGMIVKAFEHIKSEYMKLGEPMLLFFDEAEAIVGSRQLADASSGAQENIAIVDAIIVGVDSLRKGMQARIVVLFATNLIGHIDPALMRRCYYHHFERPDTQTRRALFETSLRGLNFSPQDIDQLVDATRPKLLGANEVPFTHSDIVELIIGRAIYQAIKADTALTIEYLLDACRKAIPAGFLTARDR